MRFVRIFAFGLLMLGPAKADEIDIGGYPLVLVCDVGNVLLVGYLSEIGKEGGAVYISANGRQSIVIGTDGMLYPTETMRAEGSCAGRSLAELKADGRAFMVLRP
ncbi:hypothetical protein LNKW23_43370 [Paralimibaculum aggregatum]|uniref:Uncharacterized protein n=1 Tax=Paralimibaculum aggregatum TaxID=3036245 RepID=A0ABQ6LSS8_9RHOB|nr:hypothetical protein LNKW23_43370 [Limibaculum sp. NKW23]